jgi:DNA-binding transcriptional LysR family regulator
MELRDLEYFAVVAEQGSVRRAAEALGLSQPALSKCLRRLEAATETALVRRTPKGVALTAAGERLLGYGQRLRRSKEEIAKEIRDLRQGHGGHLHLGAGPAMAEDLLPAACAALFAQAPRVTLRVAIVTNDLLMPALRNGEFELAVSGIPAWPPEDLAQEPLYDDEFVVIAAADHPLARRGAVTLAQLAGERWALSQTSVLSERALRSAFAQRGLPPPRVAIEANVASLRFCLVSSSGFLGFTSRRSLARERKRHRLAEIAVRDMTWRRRVGVSYRRDGYLSPLARRFIAILKAGSAGAS